MGMSEIPLGSSPFLLILFASLRFLEENRLARKIDSAGRWLPVLERRPRSDSGGGRPRADAIESIARLAVRLLVFDFPSIIVFGGDVGVRNNFAHFARPSKRHIHIHR